MTTSAGTPSEMLSAGVVSPESALSNGNQGGTGHFSSTRYEYGPTKANPRAQLTMQDPKSSSSPVDTHEVGPERTPTVTQHVTVNPQPQQINSTTENSPQTMR